MYDDQRILEEVVCIGAPSAMGAGGGGGMTGASRNFTTHSTPVASASTINAASATRND